MKYSPVMITTDYAKFKYSTLYNRDIKKHKALALSLVDYGKIISPILVSGEDQVVLDGQHRLDIAKSKGIPIPYIEVYGADTRIVPAILNSTQKPWSLADYVSKFNKLNISSYVWLNEQNQKYRLSISLICRLAGTSVTDAFKAGKLEVDLNTRKDTERHLKCTSELQAAIKVSPYPTRIKYLVQVKVIPKLKEMLLHPNYNHKEMIKRLKSEAASKLRSTNSSRDAAEMFEDIYNYGKPKTSKSRIKLT